MADERSRLRSYSITAACLHASGAGSAQRTRGKRLALPPSPEASPPPGRTAARSRPRWEPGYFPRSFTTSKKAPGGGEAPCSHGEGCGCIPAHLPPAPGGLFRAAPAPAAAPTPPPATPTKVGPGAARPLLGGSSCERTRLLSPGLLTPVSAQPLRTASAFLPPCRARRRGAAPPPSLARRRLRAGAERGPKLRRPRPLSPARPNSTGGSRHKGESLQPPARAPVPPRRPRRPAPPRTIEVAPDIKLCNTPSARLYLPIKEARSTLFRANKNLAIWVAQHCHCLDGRKSPIHNGQPVLPRCESAKPPVASHTRPGSRATKGLKKMQVDEVLCFMPPSSITVRDRPILRIAPLCGRYPGKWELVSGCLV
ncbi:nascent polypeptide-associated complex subunit alpha, muscle-specific form-like [Vidua chalybeata]|uniref:nascent polypeptide-associated complex subunit alpha, muscle-specific form-like n=1 Tax=Vidua chalybeata TaxID=81927 RepID=UPI0023A909EB|nr:nascent polypeptide-associated complex subunit alpha, muscle-specific form-like [Vidua chalybeata]